ncbi:MAG: S-methyl-5'-thioadenosine phosphorylase, partial [Anaerolineales bacterium]
FTKDRKRTFFEGNCVVHISIPDPFCERLSENLYHAIEKTGVTVHRGGSMITIEGPRFSTKSESNIFRSWGMSVIGMTTSPEAFLAREAEICYAVMAHVTDYDVWHVSESPVTVEQVIQVLNHNTSIAQDAVKNLARDLPLEQECACKHALENALITQPNQIPPETRQKLDILIGKYLK